MLMDSSGCQISLLRNFFELECACVCTCIRVRVVENDVDHTYMIGKLPDTCVSGNLLDGARVCVEK